MTQIGEGIAAALFANASEQAKKEDKKRIKIRLSLFFDGTNNNRVNVRAREQNSGAYQVYGADNASYANDLSNVARLEENLLDTAANYDHFIAVYTEGIGTVTRGEDSTIGGITGMGPTGIEVKVTKGIRAALNRLPRLGYKPRDTIIEKISIDTCGFSRGAAAARYCVHRVLNDTGDHKAVKATLESRGWQVEKVEVIAVGLFDTVSSHGIVHRNDVAELKLDAISQATKVLQLAAAEEYRENFSLTNIDSASDGRQVYLPGAHSDVGGGYVEGGESQILLSGAKSGGVARFLLDRGWYKKGPENKQLDHVVTAMPSGGVVEYVSVKRNNILREYTFIPLHIMADWMVEQGLSISGELKQAYNPSSVPGRARIESYAKSATGSQPKDWEGIDAELAQLRNLYLHISFRSEIGMGARIVNEGTFWKPQYRPYRLVYHG